MDFRVFLTIIIQQEQGFQLSFDQDAYYYALMKLAKDPTSGTASDWLLVTTGSTEILGPLLQEPYSYIFTEKTVDEKPELVLTKKHLIWSGGVFIISHRV